MAPKGPDEGAGFGHLVGREKVNCPAGAREAGLGHDSSRRFAGFRPAGRGTFPAGGLSSEVQRFVKKEFKRRFPAQAFAGATI